MPTDNLELFTIADINAALSKARSAMQESEFIEKNKNLFDKSVFFEGFIDNTGSIVPHATAKHSDYIPIKASQDYAYQGYYGASTRFIEYDVDKNIINILPNDGTSQEAADGIFTSASNAAFVRFSIRDVTNFMLEEGSVISPYEPYYVAFSKNYLPPVKEFKNTKIVAFGDSITFLEGGWLSSFASRLGGTSLTNYAVKGQKIAWRAGTIETTTVPVDGNDNNVLWNSIKKYESEAAETPDAFIIFEGTNDISQASPLGTYADAFSQEESLTDHMTMASAFRKALHYLISNYPNTIIFYCTPIQSKAGGRNYTNLSEVADINSQVAKRLGVQVFDLLNCGISDEFELTNGAGRYLEDGVHPNADGRELIGRVIANNFYNAFYNGL